MKRKQVLAFLMCMTMVAGNVTTASAADIVSKDGQIVFTEIQETDDNEKAEQKDNNKERKEVKKVKKEKKTEKASDEENLQFLKKEFTMKKGEIRLDLKKYLKLSGTEDPEIRPANFNWISSDESIVKINENGEAAAVDPGTATITVTYLYGKNVQATCTITVLEEEVVVKGIEIESSSGGSLETGADCTLCAKVDSDEPVAVAWHSADESIAEIDNYDPFDNEAFVTGISPGTTTITATAGDKSATYKLTVIPYGGIIVDSIKLDKTEVTMKKGDSIKLNAEIKASEEIDADWISWDTSIAEVDEDGNVTAVAPGTVDIIARASYKSATCKVTVSEDGEIALESIKLDKTAISGKAGDTEKLTVSYNPDNTTVDKTVNWSTSDKKVATVDENGNVSMVGEGTATITAEVVGKTATCEVTVTKAEVPLESISLNKSSLNMNVYETFQLKVNYNPSNTTVDKKVKWSGSVENIRVDENGLVTAYGPGSTTITAEVAGKTATCKVTVKKKEVALESIKLNKTKLNGKVGDTEKLTVSYNPDNTTVDKTVAWSSSDSKVASVDSQGNVKMNDVGTATITANVAGKTATCKVTVSKKEVVLESIKLDKTSVKGEVGDKEKLTVSYNPDNTTVDRTVNWSTSDAKVATVDKDGNVAMVGEGSATITAEVARKTATCKVTVKKKEVALESIKLNKTELNTKVGDTNKLVVSYNPDNTTVDKKVKWSSSDKKVADVDKDGNVTSVAPGTATITAEVDGRTTTCKVTVNKKEVALKSIKLDKTSVKGEVGDTEKLVVSYNPDNTTIDRTVNWSTSDAKVATVDKVGNIAMVGEGTATITAEVAGKTATCKVTVSKKEVALECIKLDKTAISGKAGDTEKLTVSYNPDNTTVDKTVNWSTSDADVATVDKDGNVVLVGVGTATITAEVAGKTATCVVTVSEEEVVVESIRLDKIEADMKKGDSLKLNAEVKANKDVVVVWISSDESIATVDENGNVTALASGTVTITATVGDKTATCTITVTDDSEKPEKPEKPQKPEQPNKPSKPEKPNKPSTKPNAAPKTSDPAMLGLWGAALAVSGGVLAKLGLSKKKKDSDEE